MSNRGGRAAAFASGILVGAAAGAIAGLLTAPRTGKQTRQILKQSADALPDLAEDLSNTVQGRADRATASALRNLDSTLLRLKEAIAIGIEVSREPRDGEAVVARQDATPE